jgi:hypothetical protein
MYILTYKNKPITLGKVLDITSKSTHSYYDNEPEHALYIAAPTKKAVKEQFIHYVGFTFAEWKPDGFAIFNARDLLHWLAVQHG